MNSKNIIEVSKTNMVSIRGEIDIYSIEKFRDKLLKRKSRPRRRKLSWIAPNYPTWIVLVWVF